MHTEPHEGDSMGEGYGAPGGSEMLDCLIIGGGPAGLTAATYLARFLRNILLIDGGNPRIAWIPRSHNYPGVPEGMHGEDALRQMQSQVKLYKVPVTNGLIRELSRDENGCFRAVHEDGRSIVARTVLLCTGVLDIEPQFDGVKQALADSVLRYCPICDGYEAVGKKTVVLGVSKGGLGEALFVRHYTPHITLFTLGKAMKLTSLEQEKLRRAEIRVVNDPVSRIEYRQDDRAIKIELQNGHAEAFDVMYSALGTKVNSELAAQAGALLDGDGKVDVDAHMQTTVPGLYAAGDIVVGLNQIAVAMGQAAIAATAIHNSLNIWHH